MRSLFKLAAMSARSSLIAGTSLADRKPSGSKPADAQTILQLYTGHTWDWTKGGSYWGSGGSFEAIWDESYASGKWWVTTKGRLCYNALWTWKDADTNAAKTGDPFERCWKHVVDKDGQIWQCYHEKSDGCRLGNETLKFGKQVVREVKKLRRKLGI